MCVSSTYRLFKVYTDLLSLRGGQIEPGHGRTEERCKREQKMIEPVALKDFFLTFFSAAMVIMTGGLYALLFAYARLRNRPGLMPLAYASYLGLFISVITLAFAANLFNSGFWTVIVLLMLIGYLVAPHAIWHLCVGTHRDEETDEADPVKVFSTVVKSRGV